MMGRNLCLHSIFRTEAKQWNIVVESKKLKSSEKNFRELYFHGNVNEMWPPQAGWVCIHGAKPVPKYRCRWLARNRRKT